MNFLDSKFYWPTVAAVLLVGIVAGWLAIR